MWAVCIVRQRRGAASAAAANGRVCRGQRRPDPIQTQLLTCFRLSIDSKKSPSSSSTMLLAQLWRGEKAPCMAHRFPAHSAVPARQGQGPRAGGSGIGGGGKGAYILCMRSVPVQKGERGEGRACRAPSCMPVPATSAGGAANG